MVDDPDNGEANGEGEGGDDPPEAVGYAVVDDATGICVGRAIWDGVTEWAPPPGTHAVRDPDGLIQVPTPPAEVPPTISALRGRLVLRDNGLLDAVTAAVAAEDEHSDVRIKFDHAGEWDRYSPEVAQIAATVGLSEQQLDDLFRQGA